MFTLTLIIFLYAIAGFGVAGGLFLRVKSKLDLAQGKMPHGKYWGVVLTLVSLCTLCFLILKYKDGILSFGLGIFFGTAILGLLYFYALFLLERKRKK